MVYAKVWQQIITRSKSSYITICLLVTLGWLSWKAAGLSRGCVFKPMTGPLLRVLK